MVILTQAVYYNYLLLISIGMFLWVHLIIEGLLSQTTLQLKEVQETLKNLPEGLEQALVTRPNLRVLNCLCETLRF